MPLVDTLLVASAQINLDVLSLLARHIWFNDLLVLLPFLDLKDRHVLLIGVEDVKDIVLKLKLTFHKEYICSLRCLWHYELEVANVSAKNDEIVEIVSKQVRFRYQ